MDTCWKTGESHAWLQILSVDEKQAERIKACFLCHYPALILTTDYFHVNDVLLCPWPILL